MKKTTILIIVVLFMVIGYAAYNTTINIYGNGKLAENLSDFKVYLSNLKVNGKEVNGINSSKDEFTINDINGDISVDVINDSTEYDTESYLECVKEDENVGKVWNYDYTGGEQTFTAPTTGTYKLETWGAQGGSINETYYGGYGAYSFGNIKISQNDKLYINVGGTGKIYEYPNVVDKTTNGNIKAAGGYNGGGNGIKYWTDSLNSKQFNVSGGGASHIALISGVLSNLESKKEKILLVASGGSGAQYFKYNSGETYNYGFGASGGGVEGTEIKCSSDFSNAYLTDIRPASQTYGGSSVYNVTEIATGSFGQGSSSYSGGGGGYYGGSSNFGITGSGSSYIGNSLLTEKSMYCYNCQESSEISTKTISTTCVNATPTAACAKSGNGYARISLISSPTNVATDKVTIKAQESDTQVINNITGKSVTCKLKLNKVSRTKKAYDGQKKWTYDYTGNEQVFTAPINGTYKFELWGAQGGAYYQAANGSYVSGELVIKKGEKFYVYVGRTGLDSSSTDYVFNYGYQNYIKTGGGATDIRLVNGNWDSLSSLVSRIMVAGGGGSQGGLNPTDGGNPYGGSAGGLVGYQGGSCISGNVTEHKGAKGATQTSGHAFGSVPLLNTGGNYFFNNSGGNGYWSGNFYDWVGAGGHNAVSGAGGGSSFISGHTGCVAILSQNSTTPRSDSKGATCKDGTTDITCSYHYSNIIFKNTIMIDGEGYSWTTVKGKKTSMPSHDGLSTIVGNNSNGYAKITLISQD